MATRGVVSIGSVSAPASAITSAGPTPI